MKLYSGRVSPNRREGLLIPVVGRRMSNNLNKTTTIFRQVSISASSNRVGVLVDDFSNGATAIDLISVNPANGRRILDDDCLTTFIAVTNLSNLDNGSAIIRAQWVYNR